MLERYQCPSCDAIFGPQKYLDLSEEFVSRDYALLYNRYQETNSTETEIRTFRSLDPKPGRLYLNWGCGIWSETISRLRAESFEVWGFEPSAPVSSPYIATSRDQISARFDGIFSNNVIEHFRNPRHQFEEFLRILKPGGMMARFLTLLRVFLFLYPVPHAIPRRSISEHTCRAHWLQGEEFGRRMGNTLMSTMRRSSTKLSKLQETDLK